MVARSSAEAEFEQWLKKYVSCYDYRRLEDKVGWTYEPILFAISIAHNPVQHDRTEHIEMDRHFIKDGGHCSSR